MIRKLSMSIKQFSNNQYTKSYQLKALIKEHISYNISSYLCSFAAQGQQPSGRLDPPQEPAPEVQKLNFHIFRKSSYSTANTVQVEDKVVLPQYVRRMWNNFEPFLPQISIPLPSHPFPQCLSLSPPQVQTKLGGIFRS